MIELLECADPDCDMLVEGVFCRWHKRRLPQPRVSKKPVRPEDDDTRVTGHVGECFYCGRRKPLTRDHVIPQALGRQFRRPWNIVWACDFCNGKKGSMHLADWLRRVQDGKGDERYALILGRARRFVTALLTDHRHAELRRYRRLIDPWWGDEPMAFVGWEENPE